MTKQHIEQLLQQAVITLQESGELPETTPLFQVDATKDKAHGDFASNIALVLAKAAGKKPRELATRLTEVLPPSSAIQKIELAGPGFINFFLSSTALTDIIKTVLNEKAHFGRSPMGDNKRVLVEFLSSNPTGPLHVGHGRHAAFGAVISNLLSAVGFNVYREYYVNDAGRQMDILATSIWLRYLGLCGETFTFPSNGYRGEYIIDIAKAIYDMHGTHFVEKAARVFEGLPYDEPEGGDKEVYIDAVVKRAKTLLGDKYPAIFTLGLSNIMADIREDLTEFGVHYDNWFSEREFVKGDVVDRLLKTMESAGHVYEHDGALWFRSTEFQDEKDRVLVRSNGDKTYFANDVAYHLSKFERRFDIAIDIFGADHHGYVPRMKAAMQASHIDPERLVHVLVQFVTLYRNGKQVQMSTRGGSFVTLRELREEVGNDAARYFYVMRKADQHMDFDLDLAKSQSNENPVYYVQYAHARICSVLRQLAGRELQFDEALGFAHLDRLVEPQERDLLNTMSRYPDMIVNAALQYEPHQLTNYLREFAHYFHSYYNAHQILVDDNELRNARLALMMAVKQILLNGFELLGISAKETM